MKLYFSKVILHNFLSYGHAEIDLRNKHFCLVSGVNKHQADNAQSNGSGKTTWGSAICWALTGKTLSGISSSVKNIFIDEDSCYVTLEFSADESDFIITRYRNPKSDLKIYKNGENISGKGLKESESILAQHLPDINLQLIASTIILGQGLPFKFTDNTPSGRKDVLEKLTNSDFMIQDLKDRIGSRLDNLNKDIIQADASTLASQTLLERINKDIEAKKAVIAQLSSPHDFDKEIKELEEKINKASSKLRQTVIIQNDADTQLEEYTEKLNSLQADKLTQLTEDLESFNNFKSDYIQRKSDLASQIKAIENEIIKLEQITDICPTCGQKIPNVIKPDTSSLHQEKDKLYNDLLSIETKFTECEKQHLAYKSQVEKLFDENSKFATTEINRLKQCKITAAETVTELNGLISAMQLQIESKRLDKQNFSERLKTAENELYNLSLDAEKTNTQILYNIDRKNTLTNHLDIVNQMKTLVNRDFRGVLLLEIIDYIKKKAKEYSSRIFNSDNIEFILDGNNISISYDGKDFDNLSGGEKQRIDLIIQFAIRSMMEQYFNFSSNILILDEIFDQLDLTACNALLNFISETLDDVESTFIISHRSSDLSIPYDSELIIIKDERGVSSAKWQ